MGLDNFPRQCGCDKHPYDPNLPEFGATHKPGEPCPFQKDNFPKGMLGTCCSLRGEIASRELAAISNSALYAFMHVDMSAEEVEYFVGKLRATVAILKQAHGHRAVKPGGAGRNGIWNAEEQKWEYHDYSTFDEAIASVEEAARWYEKVAALGFGVRAWF